MSEPLIIRDPHNVPVTFANEVANIGFLNGIINLTLITAQFTPQDGLIVPDAVIVSRLRFDLACAQQLHSMLGEVIKENTKQGAAKTAH